MKLITKLFLWRLVYCLIWLCRLPVAIVMFPFELLLNILQVKYAFEVTKVHTDRRNMTEKDISAALWACSCPTCLKELQDKYTLTKGPLTTNIPSVNNDQQKCMFCGKPTKEDPKTKRKYCVDCG